MTKRLLDHSSNLELRITIFFIIPYHYIPITLQLRKLGLMLNNHKVFQLVYKKKGKLNHTALLFVLVNVEYFLLKRSFLFLFFFCGRGYILTQGTMLCGS